MEGQLLQDSSLQRSPESSNPAESRMGYWELGRVPGDRDSVWKDEKLWWWVVGMAVQHHEYTEWQRVVCLQCLRVTCYTHVFNYK